MITDLLLVAGGALGGALLTWSFVNWEDRDYDYRRRLDETVRRHPSQGGGDE